MINPAFDVWVWATGLLFLVLMGVRAYVVETGQVRLGGTPAAARLLTMAIFLVLIGLGGLLALQGGTLLVSSIVNRTGTGSGTCSRACSGSGTCSRARTGTRSGSGTCSGTGPRQLTFRPLRCDGKRSARSRWAD